MMLGAKLDSGASKHIGSELNACHAIGRAAEVPVKQHAELAVKRLIRTAPDGNNVTEQQRLVLVEHQVRANNGIQGLNLIVASPKRRIQTANDVGWLQRGVEMQFR